MSRRVPLDKRANYTTRPWPADPRMYPVNYPPPAEPMDWLRALKVAAMFLSVAFFTGALIIAYAMGSKQ